MLTSRDARGTWCHYTVQCRRACSSMVVAIKGVALWFQMVPLMSVILFFLLVASVASASACESSVLECDGRLLSVRCGVHELRARALLRSRMLE